MVELWKKSFMLFVGIALGIFITLSITSQNGRFLPTKHFSSSCILDSRTSHVMCPGLKNSWLDYGRPFK